MASNYSVDEILEEVRRKKRAAQTPARQKLRSPRGATANRRFLLNSPA
jgi:hypothetical protein